ncbi:MAG TPA: hypothetical protein VMX13_13765 [Sedimentisphaerales bacterium]|nr:hypothetical protein [Sedimentisphaerales bacterium]
MKNLEVWALVLVVLYAVSLIASPLYSVVVNPPYGIREMSGLPLYVVSAVYRLSAVFVNIGVAAWLGLQARKEGLSWPIWALFGLFFSVVGAVLYFVIRGQKENAAA